MKNNKKPTSLLLSSETKKRLKVYVATHDFQSQDEALNALFDYYEKHSKEDGEIVEGVEVQDLGGEFVIE